MSTKHTDILHNKPTPPKTELPPEDESYIRLSEADAMIFLDILENPPRPTEAAREAAKLFVRQYG